MSLAFVTSGHSALDGVFWQSYLEAGGPMPSCIYVLPTRRFQRRRWQVGLDAICMMGLRGCLSMLLAGRLPGKRVVAEGQGLGRELEELFPDCCFEAPVSLNEEGVMTSLRESGVSTLVSVGSTEIFGDALLAVIERGLNVHNGRLPAYRGLIGTFWEMYHREPAGYVTIHEMASAVDSGVIVDEQSIDIAYPCRLYDVLVAKKILGGSRLAAVLNGRGERCETASGRICESAYFGWPSPSQVVKFVYRTRMLNR